MSKKSRLLNLRSNERMVTYLFVAAMMLVLAVVTYNFHWQGTQQLHSLLELASTITAFFVGVMALSMYRADSSQTSLLILSLGFFGTAVLDGYHCIATTSMFASLFPSSIESLVPWSWHASRTYLSIFLCLALWVTGKRELQRNQIARFATWSAVMMTTGCFIFFAFCPLPPAYFSGAIGGRPQEYIPALFFLIAVVGHLRTNEWRSNRLEHWCIISLIVGVSTQAIFMSQSHAIFDCMFDLSHVLKIVSYAVVGVGLTLSMSDLFRSAEEAKLLAFAVNQTQHGILILRGDSQIEFANEGFEQLTNFDSQEVIGRSVSEVLFCEAENEEKMKIVTESIQGGKNAELEFQCLNNYGDSFWAAAEIHPVADMSGGHSQFIMFIRDVTAQRLAEKEKAKLTEELLVVSRQAGMSEIATGALHNVGNVLNSVNVSASVLQRNIEQGSLCYMDRIVKILSEQSDFAKFVIEDERGQNLPRVLTQVAERLKEERESNKLELQSLAENIDHIKQIIGMQQSIARVGGVTEDLDVIGLVHDALKMHETGIARHMVEVVWDVDDDLPGISTDRHKVLQILVNFIGNAKQAMSGNSDSDRILKISVRFDGSDFHIHMRDNGSGIAKENLPKIFNHGFTTKADGHGFGLHSSALAARELGGSLSVQSDGEGLGATFSLRLPPCRPQDDRFDESLTADTDQSFTVVNG